MGVRMSDLMPFEFEGREVRIIQDDSGMPWFVAKDVCEVLELGNTTEATRGLDDDERSDLSIPEVSSNGVVQNRRTIVINEPGLYSLVLRSRKPEAKAFKRWITHDVLPSIRKTGAYVHPAAPSSSASPVPGLMQANRLYMTMLAVAKQIFPNKNQALLSADKATRKATGTSPLAMLDATHLVATSQSRILTPTEIGREFGMSAVKANKLLEGCGLQEQDANKQWLPTSAGAVYAVFLDTGKSHGDGTPVRQLKWNSDVLSAVRGFVAGQDA